MSMGKLTQKVTAGVEVAAADAAAEVVVTVQAAWRRQWQHDDAIKAHSSDPEE